MVAAIPIAFGAHQFVEGVVWSSTPGGDPHVYAARLFAFLAYFVWPIYAPLAFYRYEREVALKKRLLPLIALGALAGLFFLYFMIADPVEVVVRRGSLSYRFDYPLVMVYPIHMSYGIPVMLAPALSRDKVFKVLGVSMFLWYLIAYYGWRGSHPSVWCYFAALLSGLIYLHFRLRGRTTARVAIAD